MGNPIALKLLEKLLVNTRGEIKKEIVEELGGKLDLDRAASIASEVGIKLEQPKLNSLIMANAISLIETSFKESELDEISKTITKSILELSSTFGFLSNTYYFSPFVWKIYLQLAELIYPGESQKFRNFSGEIAVLLLAGKFNSKESLGYQLPSIELSAGVANIIVPSVTADFGYYIDYCHEVLGCDRDINKWNIFKDLITNCGWIFPYEKTVLICDRK